MSPKHSIETLASLAKECKMATQRETSINELNLQIQHTIYMRDVMRSECLMSTTPSDHVVRQSALQLIEKHLEDLEAQLYEAELIYRFRTESI